VDFRWNEWNAEHVGQHGIEPEAAEHVVEEATAPYPRRIGEDKLRREKRRYRRQRR
jgi:hypothetical protein